MDMKAAASYQVATQPQLVSHVATDVAAGVAIDVATDCGNQDDATVVATICGN